MNTRAAITEVLHRAACYCLAAAIVLAIAVPLVADTAPNAAPGSNPIFRDVFTADPAPLVVGDTLYVYVGHDEAGEGQMFNISEWLCYSTTDMKTWTAHGAIMKPTDFEWATGDAWASQVVEWDDKYWFYTTVQHGPPHIGKAIGVAVADNPLGPFEDARGTALVTDGTTPSPYGWNDIDPSVFVDDDGTAWIAWGNPVLYLAKLKPNMIEFDGAIQKIALPNYTEGPWISKRDALYYITYPAFAHQGFDERMCYATAPSMTGPWTYQGLLTGAAKNSYTIHPGIVEFQGQSYLFYHNAILTLPDGRTGALGRRSVCVEYLFYNPDGTMQPVVQTEEGVSVPPKPVKESKPAPVDHGQSDPRVNVTQFAGQYPSSWPDTPAVATVSNPFAMTPVPLSFNRDGGVTSVCQTFIPRKDVTLFRLSLYAGDGLGTDPDNPLMIALYDLGPSDFGTEAESYSAETNLLGAGDGLHIAYEPQGAGLLHIDFAENERVVLRAGRRYVLEFQSRRDSACFFWRQSRSDVYPDGDAYRNRKRIKDRQGRSVDFAFAIYGGGQAD